MTGWPMNRSMSELERRLAELEQRFSDIENLNNLLSRQVKEYFLLFDSIRKISSAIRLKDFYKILDKIFKNNFNKITIRQRTVIQIDI